jgi:hypothetical protein
MNGNGFVASVEQALVPIHRLLLIGIAIRNERQLTPWRLSQSIIGSSMAPSFLTTSTMSPSSNANSRAIPAAMSLASRQTTKMSP